MTRAAPARVVRRQSAAPAAIARQPETHRAAKLAVTSQRTGFRPWRYVLPGTAVMAAMFAVMAVSLDQPWAPKEVSPATAPRAASAPPAPETKPAPATEPAAEAAPPAPSPAAPPAPMPAATPVASPPPRQQEFAPTPQAGNQAPETGPAPIPRSAAPAAAAPEPAPRPDAERIPIPPRHSTSPPHASPATQAAGSPSSQAAPHAPDLPSPPAPSAASHLAGARRAIAADDLTRARVLLAQAETEIVFQPAEAAAANRSPAVAAEITRALGALNAGDRDAALASIGRAMAGVGAARPSR